MNHKLILNIFVILVLLSSCTKENIIYVDQSSFTEKQDGSIQAPFHNLESALSFIKNERQARNMKPIKLLIRNGVYYFDKGFILDSLYSNLTISAYPEESVIFSGGRNIPLHLISSTVIGNNNIQEIDLKKAGIYSFGKIKNTGFSRPFYNSWGELFINNRPMHLSRWPNIGMIQMGEIIDEGAIPRNNDFSGRGAIMRYDSLKISEWSDKEDMWISGYFRHGYADDALKIKKIDRKNQTIQTEGPTLYGFYSGNNWNKWFAFNIFEETDSPGEYYVNQEDGKVYFISPEPEISTLHFSILEEPFFDIFDSKNIIINDIIFEYSRATHISLCETDNVLIRNCVFRNSGDLGIIIGEGIEPFEHYIHEGTGNPIRGSAGSLQQHLYKNQTFNRNAGKNNCIQNCKFYELGSGGVSMGGGDRLTLADGNNQIIDCIFHDNNRIARSYRPAVHITGVGNKIIGCEMYNAPSMAILMHGNNHIIEDNYIHNVCMEVDDQGAFYYGRNPSECGSIIRNNIFANIPDTYSTCAIYHDDGAGGLTVENNIFYRAGRYAVLMGGGSDNHYSNNLFINCPTAIHIDNRLQNWGKSLVDKNGLFEQRLKEINYNTPPYITQYPFLSGYIPNNGMPKRNKISQNYFIGVNSNSDNPDFLIWTDNKVISNPIEIVNCDKRTLLEIANNLK